MSEKIIGVEEELYLAPEEKIKNAEEIAEVSLQVKARSFIIQYEPSEKETLISELEKIGCTVSKQMDFANCVVVSMSMLQLKAIKTLECVKTVEKDYDYKVLTNGMNEKEYTAYLAGVDPKINERKEIKLAVFDTATSNSVVNFAEDADETDNSNVHGGQMVGIVSSVIADKENRIATPLIYPVVVANHRGFAKTSAIMQAIDWAINNGIKIINMSLGDYRKSNMLEQMINKASKCGIIMVAAVGNDGGFKDENRIMYPAAYKNVISVGAKDGEAVATYSNGGTNADCFAPGTQNTTDSNGNTVGVIGTSAATAFVSGSILKKWCITPESSAKEIIAEIKFEMVIAPKEENNTEVLTSAEENGTILSENSDKISEVSVASLDASAMSSNGGISLLCYEDEEDENQDQDDSLSNSMANATSLSFLYWHDGYINCPGDEVWYKFTANVSDVHPNGDMGWYLVHTQGMLDTVGYLYDSYGNQIAYNDDGDGSNNSLSFKIWARLSYGETYYVRVKAYGSNTGDFDIRVSYFSDEQGDSPRTATEIIGVYYEDQSISSGLHSNNDVDYYSFVPARNCVMEIYTEGDTDTYGELYCSSGALLDSDNDSNGNGNFKITAHLEEMKRYYIAVRHNSPTDGGQYTLRFKFVRDYYPVPSSYYSKNKRPIIAWYNNSYTEYPSNTSLKYYMYMNKASSTLWKEKFLPNKSFAEVLLEAIESNVPSELELALHSMGIQTISMTDTILDIITDCIISLIEPYIQRAFFDAACNSLADNELLCVSKFTARESEYNGTIIPTVSYNDYYSETKTSEEFVYGKDYFRGEWAELELTED